MKNVGSLDHGLNMTGLLFLFVLLFGFVFVCVSCFVLFLVLLFGFVFVLYLFGFVLFIVFLCVLVWVLLCFVYFLNNYFNSKNYLAHFFCLFWGICFVLCVLFWFLWFLWCCFVFILFLLYKLFKQ